MRRLLFVFAVLLVTFWMFRQPISHPPGVLIPQSPIQILLPDSSISTIREGFTIRPLATYIVEGRVLSTKHYLTDPVHTLAPYDVGIGWGKMSDSTVIVGLKLSQSNRFLFWRWENQPPISPKEITEHASNHHLIAANKTIAHQIAWLRDGELIRLEGVLIEATSATGQKWTSSLRRDDSGNGACEIMWVSRLTKL